MKNLTPGRLLTAAVVITTAALIVFTVLQYRSSREITRATGVRLADTLQMSLVNWHVEFERQFNDLTGELDRQTRGQADAAAVTAALTAWRTASRYPALIRSVSMRGCAEHPSTIAVVEGAAPAPLLPLPVATAPGARPVWTFYPQGPALARLVMGAHAPCWLVVAIDREVLTRSVLPDLALRYFSGTDGLDYDVALLSGWNRILYASAPEFGRAPTADADGILNVFGRRSSTKSRGPYEVFHMVPQREHAPTASIMWFALPPDAGEADDWRLVVRHRRGGALGAFLANAQRRDLLNTLGGLGLLVTSITLLVVASHRAQRLAQLQLSFVTAVSHELRTPIAVIDSAADNIARGVVREAAHVTEYGSVIRQQSRQLGALVERILLFAGRTSGAPRPVMQRLDVARAIDATLSNVLSITSGAPFTVERDMPPDLPPVLGDATGLAQCLENLLTNAVKYGGTGRWIGVRAYTVRTPEDSLDVCIDISDRGLGVPPADRERIFEPFHRGAAAVAAQIHGTGLGLALARTMADMMDGEITLRSEPGQGSTFTLRLPAAPPKGADS